MLINNLKIAIRYILKQKKDALIIILGLAISLASAFFIYGYVYYEKHYDVFHANADELYRVVVDAQRVGEDAYKSPYSYAAQGPTATDEVPEVLAFTRLMTFSDVVVMREGASNSTDAFSLSEYYYADDNFFSVFSFPLIQGNPEDVLKEPGSMVIGPELAEKLFGNQSPVGEKVVINGQNSFTVTGVFEAPSGASHLKFQALLSLSTHPWIMNSDMAWNNHSFFTYLKLIEGADAKQVEQKITASFKKENRAINQMECIWHLQSVKDAYLKVDDFTSKPGVFKFGNNRMIYFLNLIAILILFIGWINYINLTTAKATDKHKELMVRKTNGATQWQLFVLYFTESIVMNLLAFLFASVVTVIFKSFFEQVGSFSFPQFSNYDFWLTIGGAAVISILFPGIYSAITLLIKNPLRKKAKQAGRINFSYRNALVVFQFIIIIVFIGGVIGINKQLKYINSIELGFQTDQVLVINAPRVAFADNTMQQLETFRQELSKHAGVADATASASIPGQRFGNGNGGPVLQGQPNENTYFRVGRVMPNYVDFYDIPLLAGRTFDGQEHQIVINKEAVAEYGFSSVEDVLNKTVKWFGETYTIIGVTESFHQESLHILPEPQIFYTQRIENDFNYIMVKINGDNIHQIIADVEDEYQAHFPGNPVNYFFLDKFFNQQYQKDITFRKLFSLFSLLALFIGFLGLYGLTNYRVVKRIKEIGVRKVNGAKMFEILSLLNKDFVTGVGIAFIVATPIAWYAMSRWLENFAYKTNLSWWIFALAGVLALGVALLTVSCISWNVARRNPVEALRYE